MSKYFEIDLFRFENISHAQKGEGKKSLNIFCHKTATGEPPLMMSSSAVFAIRQAVEAARAEIGQYSYVPLSKYLLNKRCLKS